MRVFRAEIRLIQISLAVSVVIIAIVLAIPGFRDEDAAARLEGNTAAQTQEMGTDNQPVLPKIVCLGDSYTFGYPYKQESSSWPHYLAEKLGKEVANEGKMQQTSADLLARFDEDIVKKYNPRTVIIMSGAGDALSTEPVPLEAYQANIQGLVQKARDNNIKPILILPFSFSSDDTPTLIPEYRKWLMEYAGSDGVDIVDVQPMLCDEENGIKKQYAYSDNAKYPNEEGYKEIGFYIAEQIKDKVE